ncbi:MAG: histidinol-phosphate transaminase [Promethearchaeia archaeon]
MNVNQLKREILKKFSPYEPGEQPQGEGWVKLNTNENPYPPVPEVLEEIKGAVNERLRKYPDPTAFEVRKELLNRFLSDKSTLTNRNTVFIGNGSDENLDIICKTFIDPGDEVVFFKPSYGMYKVLASLYGAKITELDLTEDFSMPEEAYSAEGKLFFICSPNNPNGKSFENEAILKICESFPGIVVVDEAYGDFSETTALPLLRRVKNLIVSRTFSKSFSLASLRFGYALADSEIIKELNKVKLPYNVSHLTQVAALACIKHKDKMMEQNKKIIEERNRLREELSKYEGIEVLPSDANFLFVKFEEKSKTLKFVWDLKDKKILVRHFSKSGLYEYIRITIGTQEENDKFLEVFDELASQYL